jgi:hypothetical protein
LKASISATFSDNDASVIAEEYQLTETFVAVEKTGKGHIDTTAQRFGHIDKESQSQGRGQEAKSEERAERV